MRWIFLLLLLGNVLYFGWEFDRQTRINLGSSANAMSVPAGTAELSLLSELPEAPSAREAPAPEGGPVPVPAEELVASLPEIAVPEPMQETGKDTCFSFGPVPDERQAVGLSDWFRSRRINVATRHAEDRNQQLFWIYLAPPDSTEVAMRTIRDLERKGVSDFRLIARGDLANAVSLGLFSSQDAVDKRLGELRDKGYKPVVVPYSDVQRIYWVDVRVPGQSDLLEQMLNGYPARFNPVPVKCDQIAIASGSP